MAQDRDKQIPEYNATEQHQKVNGWPIHEHGWKPNGNTCLIIVFTYVNNSLFIFCMFMFGAVALIYQHVCLHQNLRLYRMWLVIKVRIVATSCPGESGWA